MAKVAGQYVADYEGMLVDGGIRPRKYAVLPGLPSPDWPTGTMVRDSTGTVRKVNEAGTDWDSVAGAASPFEGSFANNLRPDPATITPGHYIRNTTSGAINFSDGTNWITADGYIA